MAGGDPVEVDHLPDDEAEGEDVAEDVQHHDGQVDVDTVPRLHHPANHSRALGHVTSCRALIGHLAGVAAAAVPLAAGEVVAAAVDQKQEAEVGEGEEQDGQQDPGTIVLFISKYFCSY